jgi:hypothetical protein
MENNRRLKRQQEIKELQGHDADTGIMEKAKLSILVSLIEDLEDSINRNSEESSKLSRSMIWLTCVIALGTLVLAAIGIVDMWLKWK